MMADSGRKDRISGTDRERHRAKRGEEKDKSIDPLLATCREVKQKDKLHTANLIDF